MSINDQHFTAFKYNTVQYIMLLLSISIYSCPLACIKHSKDEIKYSELKYRCF